MKIKLTLLALLISVVTFAQQGINYKALIKDDLGNVVANDLIQIQFSILEGVAQTNVYQESHTATTDANGLIIVNIGEGTTSDVFSDIDWSADDHFLNVQVNTGGGLTDLGTTQFMSVPYAEHSTKANIATHVTVMPKPHILGRSAQVSDGKFAINGKYGWQAAQEMCMASYPNDPNVRAFTLEQIAQAIVLGNWDTNNLSNINNVSFWAITPYAVGSNSFSYRSENQNSFGLNYNSGVLANGTRGRIIIDASISEPGFNPLNTYLSVFTNISNNEQMPCMCGTYN